MVICPECGTYVKERSMFCYNCGRPVKDDWVHVDGEIEEETFGIALSDLDGIPRPVVRSRSKTTV